LQAGGDNPAKDPGRNKLLGDRNARQTTFKWAKTRNVQSWFNGSVCNTSAAIVREGLLYNPRPGVKESSSLDFPADYIEVIFLTPDRWQRLRRMHDCSHGAARELEYCFRAEYAAPQGVKLREEAEAIVICGVLPA
jgi:hypothetical protein